MTKTSDLAKHLREMQIRSSPSISDGVAAGREQMEAERKSIKQCLAICTTASEHLREIENKVAAAREQMEAEKESTKQCLALCIKVFEHLDQLQPSLSAGSPMAPARATADALQECKHIVTNATVSLEERIQEIEKGLQTLSVRGAGISGVDATTQANVFKDVLAEEGAHQVIISPGNLISATQVSAGIETRQWLGQMSEGTIRRLSSDLGSDRAAQQAGESQED